MKNPLVLFIIFAVVGTACLVFAPYFAFKTIEQSKTWKEAPATLVGFNEEGFPLVLFMHAGDSVVFRATYSSTDMEMGDEVTVYFSPDNPEQAQIKSFMANWGAPIILSILGLAFTSIGVFGIRKTRMKANMKKELFEQKKGKVLSLPGKVRKDTQYSVNDVNPFVIDAEWLDPATKTMYTFTSEYLWYNPSTFLEGKQVDVYVDGANPKRYYIDISFLPKQAK